MPCSEVKAAKYQTRKSPPFHAKDCKNLTKKGKDGEYVSKPDAKGVYKWVKKSANKVNRSENGEPREDPNTLKIETIRKGQDNNWWWVQENGISRHMWKILLPRRAYKTRKQKKVKGQMRKNAEKMGQITVKYNTEKSCDLMTTKKSCIFPEYRSKKYPNILDNEWVHVYNEGLPDKENVEYMNKDIYKGKLEEMESYKKELQAHYNKYKKMGYISDFEIISETMKDYYKKVGEW